MGLLRSTVGIPRKQGQLESGAEPGRKPLLRSGLIWSPGSHLPRAASCPATSPLPTSLQRLLLLGWALVSLALELVLGFLDSGLVLVSPVLELVLVSLDLELGPVRNFPGAGQKVPPDLREKRSLHYPAA